jgi:hypothetical protein
MAKTSHVVDHLKGSKVAGDQKLTNHKNSDADNSSKIQCICIILFANKYPICHFMSQESSFHGIRRFWFVAIRNSNIFLETPCISYHVQICSIENVFRNICIDSMRILYGSVYFFSQYHSMEYVWNDRM